jgi:hypothetical protein
MFHGTQADPNPTRSSNIIIKGIPFDILIEMESHKITQIISEENGLSDIVDSNYIKNLDLTIQAFENHGFFGAPLRKIENIMVIDNPLDVLTSEKLKQDFQDIILEPTRRKRFIGVKNFYFTKDGRKCATGDLRVLVSSDRADIPNETMLHIASIGAMMLVGIMDYPLGYDYIREFMQRYGETEFQTNGKGYLHITVGISKNDRASRKPFKEDVKPGSKF